MKQSYKTQRVAIDMVERELSGAAVFGVVKARLADEGLGLDLHLHARIDQPGDLNQG